jgi:hypothetical protein
MVDWGVGKGVSLDLRDALHSAGLTTRKKQEWFKQFYHELAVLKYIYIEKYQLQVGNMVVNSLSN